MNSKLPLILATNDDGIDAPGLQALVETIAPFARVVVVAPKGPQSAKSHSMSIDQTMYYTKAEMRTEHPNVTAYSCSGTPVDCVKLALHGILEETPALCVSGINHGSNAAINVIYSGTMGAALEAGISGIPAIGFSLLDYNLKADFRASTVFVKQIVQKALSQNLPKQLVLNVNIPKLPIADIKGIKVCRQADSLWQENIIRHEFPMGQQHYWLEGKFHSKEPNSTDTDHWALQNGYVSVVPTQFDMTAYQHKKELENWNW